MAATRGESILPFADLTKRTHGVANFAQHIVWLWRKLPVPVIAAVHGVAVGGGFQLALGADIRYVAPGTRLAVIETKWGLVPDMAGTQLMRHLAREDVVRELTYTGRIFSAEEAFAYGFATRVTLGSACRPPWPRRGKSPRNSPDAIRAAKRLLNLAAECGAHCRPRGRDRRAGRSCSAGRTMSRRSWPISKSARRTGAPHDVQARNSICKDLFALNATAGLNRLAGFEVVACR